MDLPQLIVQKRPHQKKKNGRTCRHMVWNQTDPQDYLQEGKTPQAQRKERGTWVAQLVKHPTSAQVLILKFMGFSPALGSGLTAQSLEPASNSLSPSLSLSSSPACTLVSLCLSKIKKKERSRPHTRHGWPALGKWIPTLYDFENQRGLTSWVLSISGAWHLIISKSADSALGEPEHNNHTEIRH